MLAISALNPQQFAGASLELVVHPLNRHRVSNRTQHLDTPFKMRRTLAAQGKRWKHPDFLSYAA